MHIYVLNEYLDTSWIDGAKQTNKIEKADAILYHDGEDIFPLMYQEMPVKGVNYDIEKDVELLRTYKAYPDIPKIGIGSGADFLAIMNNDKIVTVEKDNEVDLHYITNEKFRVNRDSITRLNIRNGKKISVMDGANYNADIVYYDKELAIKTDPAKTDTCQYHVYVNILIQALLDGKTDYFNNLRYQTNHYLGRIWDSFRESHWDYDDPVRTSYRYWSKYLKDDISMRDDHLVITIGLEEIRIYEDDDFLEELFNVLDRKQSHGASPFTRDRHRTTDASMYVNDSDLERLYGNVRRTVING